MTPSWSADPARDDAEIAVEPLADLSKALGDARREVAEALRDFIKVRCVTTYKLAANLK